MKVRPQITERVYYYARGIFERRSGAVTAFVGKDKVLVYWDNGTESDIFWRALHGRLVKNPRKCKECAKPKKLFYVGHVDKDFLSYQSIICLDKEELSLSWKYTSILALISTEEVKK